MQAMGHGACTAHVRSAQQDGLQRIPYRVVPNSAACAAAVGSPVNTEHETVSDHPLTSNNSLLPCFRTACALVAHYMEVLVWCQQRIHIVY